MNGSSDCLYCHVFTNTTKNSRRRAMRDGPSMEHIPTPITPENTIEKIGIKDVGAWLFKPRIFSSASHRIALLVLVMLAQTTVVHLKLTSITSQQPNHCSRGTPHRLASTPDLAATQMQRVAHGLEDRWGVVGGVP